MAIEYIRYRYSIQGDGLKKEGKSMGILSAKRHVFPPHSDEVAFSVSVDRSGEGVVTVEISDGEIETYPLGKEDFQSYNRTNVFGNTQVVTDVFLYRREVPKSAKKKRKER